MSLGDTLLAILWFMLFLTPVFLAIWVIIDTFRSDDLSGWARGGWIIFVLVVPLIGSLVYVIARGHKHHEREERQAARQEEALRQLPREAGGAGVSTADELTKLARLRGDGVISDDEFHAEKARLLA